MSTERPNCGRCCLRIYGYSIYGFCERCTKELRKDTALRVAEGMRKLYESKDIELGSALCDKVAAEKECERLHERVGLYAAEVLRLRAPCPNDEARCMCDGHRDLRLRNADPRTVLDHMVEREELEAERDAARADAASYEAKLAAAEEENADWRDSAKNAALEDGHQDEVHCTCVGPLRKSLKDAEATIKTHALLTHDMQRADALAALVREVVVGRPWAMHDAEGNVIRSIELEAPFGWDDRAKELLEPQAGEERDDE